MLVFVVVMMMREEYHIQTFQNYSQLDQLLMMNIFDHIDIVRYIIDHNIAKKQEYLEKLNVWDVGN